MAQRAGDRSGQVHSSDFEHWRVLFHRIRRVESLAAATGFAALATVSAASISPWLAVGIGGSFVLLVAAAMIGVHRYFQTVDILPFLRHGDALARQGRLRAAERVYRRAARSGDPRAFYELARIRHRAGDLTTARDLYWQALDAGHPARGEIFGMLGELEEV